MKLVIAAAVVFISSATTNDCAHQTYSRYNKKYPIPTSSLSSTSSTRFPDFGNQTIYLGYANNPFGPSKRLIQRNVSMDFAKVSLSLTNKQIADPPSPNVTKFESMDNNVDSGRHEINVQEPRVKRGVVHLYNMVSCATGCNPLIYKGYGCYCGFLGSGYAVDGIDRCCQLHDWCYNTTNCPMFLEYFVPYFWKCYRNRPYCALKHGEWGGVGSCAQRLCECDRALSECLRRYPCPSKRALCRSSPLRLLQTALMIF